MAGDFLFLRLEEEKEPRLFCPVSSALYVYVAWKPYSKRVLGRRDRIIMAIAGMAAASAENFFLSFLLLLPIQHVS